MGIEYFKCNLCGELYNVWNKAICKFKKNDKDDKDDKNLFYQKTDCDEICCPSCKYCSYDCMVGGMTDIKKTQKLLKREIKCLKTQIKDLQKLLDKSKQKNKKNNEE